MSHLLQTALSRPDDGVKTSKNQALNFIRAHGLFRFYSAPWTKVFILLALATILDKVTGPAVSAAAFYIFPIGLAGWRIRGKAAAFMALAAIVLNATTIWLDIRPHGFMPDLLASQALQTVIYAAVAFLSTRLRSERLLLKEQKRRVEALHKQMADEMRAARALQEILFSPLPSHPSLDMGSFLAAARILGGDALDVAFSGPTLAVLVADVSGKGSPAALATAVLIGMLKECPSRFESPAQTLAFLNDRLADCLPDTMFVTALYLLLSVETGDMVWANAGHEPPLLMQTDMNFPSAQRKTVQELTGPDLTENSMPLAIARSAIYADHRRRLAPGETLFCYTDGLTDLRMTSNERLGNANLAALFAKYAHLPCADISEAMLTEVTGKSRKELASGVLDDDLSILVLRRK